MLEDELQQYLQALSDIELILSVEPDNKELLESKEALTQLLQAMTPMQPVESESTTDTSTETTETSSSALQTVEEADTSLSLDKFPVGSRVLAKWAQDNEYHIARIESIEGHRYHITYLQDGTIAEILEDDLKVFEPHSFDELVPGQAVLAVGDDDFLFYEGVIETQGQAGYGWFRIRYKSDRSRSEVTRYDIFIPPSLRDKRVKINSNLAGLDLKNAQFVIPEYLKFKDTDTESDRKMKRLKVRKLQQNFHSNVAKVYDRERVSAWKAHQSTSVSVSSLPNATTSPCENDSVSEATPVNTVKRRRFAPVSTSKGVKRK